MRTQNVKVVTPPLYEPVSLDEAKRWLRIDNTNSDDVVRLLIQAMRERAENLTLRAYIERTLCLYLSDWPPDDEYGIKIVLPYPPLIAVTSFQYVDPDGVAQEMDAADYTVHDEQEPGIIIPTWGSSWPTIRRVPDALRITYRAGYASGSPQDEAGAQEVIPAALRLWMESRIATHDELRESVVTGTIANELPRSHVDGVLDQLIAGGRLF